MNQYVVPVAVLGVSLCGIAWALLSLRKFEWALSGLPRPDEQCLQDLKACKWLLGRVLKYSLFTGLGVVGVAAILFWFPSPWTLAILFLVLPLVALCLSPL